MTFIHLPTWTQTLSIMSRHHSVTPSVVFVLLSPSSVTPPLLFFISMNSRRPTKFHGYSQPPPSLLLVGMPCNCRLANQPPLSLCPWPRPLLFIVATQISANSLIPACAAPCPAHHVPVHCKISARIACHLSLTGLASLQPFQQRLVNIYFSIAPLAQSNIAQSLSSTANPSVAQRQHRPRPCQRSSHVQSTTEPHQQLHKPLRVPAVADQCHQLVADPTSSCQQHQTLYQK